MKHSKTPKILLADDISSDPDQKIRAQTARAYAVAFAKGLGTTIDLVHVEDLTLFPGSTSYYRSFLTQFFSERKATLKQVAHSIEGSVKPIFIEGSPARTLLKLGSKRGTYELVVVGTHGRKGVGRLVLGSVAEDVIRNSTLPVLTVGPKVLTQSLNDAKILVPTELSANSKRAVDYAGSLAKRLDAQVILFHSLQDSLHPALKTASAAPSAAVQLRGMLEKLKADVLKKLTQEVGRLKKKGIKASFIFEDQSPEAWKAILEQSRKSSASLIVMGTHGRSLLTGAFFGRTARNVILDSPVPVITVRSR